MTSAWFLRNWMYAGFVSGLFLLAMTPLFAEVWSRQLLLIFLLLPIYMLHQLEEHNNDRFRLWVNANLAGGRDVLPPQVVLVINVGFVWILDLVVLYLARFVALGLGLIAVYLTLVNAVTHIVGALVLRRYNPGLVTAVVLFLPVGFCSLLVVSCAPDVAVTHQIIGVSVAVLLHAGIVVYVKRLVGLRTHA